MLKMEDIRQMPTDKLATEATKLRDEIAEMRRRVHMGEVQNTRIIRIKRREMARLLTVLGEQLSREKA